MANESEWMLSSNHPGAVGSKLSPDEKCRICGKPAMGIKYNAISCDSCRVFFRRVVLIKDRDPSRDTWSKCTLPHLRHRLPNKSQHELKLRCQHCRLLMCYASGMADHFIANSIAGQRKKTITHKNTVTANSKQPNNVIVHHHQLESTWGERLAVFWAFFVDPTSDVKRYNMAQISNTPIGEKNVRKWIIVNAQMTRWESREWGDKVLRSTVMYEFMRDSLMLHYYSALMMFNCVPEVEKQIDPQTWEELIQQTYPELMVLRWAQTVTVSSDGHYKIQSPTGVVVDTEHLSELNLLPKFLDYYQVTKQLLSCQPDERDIVLLAGLIVFDPTRQAVRYNEAQRDILISVNHSLRAMLNKKTHHEGRPFKYNQLLDFLQALRVALRDNEFDKLLLYKAKIVKSPTVD